MMAWLQRRGISAVVFLILVFFAVRRESTPTLPSVYCNTKADPKPNCMATPPLDGETK